MADPFTAIAIGSAVAGGVQTISQNRAQEKQFDQLQESSQRAAANNEIQLSEQSRIRRRNIARQLQSFSQSLSNSATNRGLPFEGSTAAAARSAAFQAADATDTVELERMFGEMNQASQIQSILNSRRPIPQSPLIGGLSGLQTGLSLIGAVQTLDAQRSINQASGVQ